MSYRELTPMKQYNISLIGNAKSIPFQRGKVKKESEKRSILCFTIGSTYRYYNGNGMIRDVSAVIKYTGWEALTGTRPVSIRNAEETAFVCTADREK